MASRRGGLLRRKTLNNHKHKPQPAKHQRVADQIKAAMIFARADFVSVLEA